MSAPPAASSAHQPTHVAGWHQEFIQRQGTPQQGPSFAQHQNYNAPFERLSSLAAMPLNMHQPMYQQGPAFPTQEAAYGTQQIPQEHMGAQPVAFDDAAFERAFAEAAKSEALATQEKEQKQQQADEAIMMNESAERLMASEPEAETERIGADLIHDPRQAGNQSHEDQNDPDALSRTAAQLLDSVKDNTSDKFLNSTFLGLMRQLRDKEVMISGDKIVDVNSGRE